MVADPRLVAYHKLEGRTDAMSSSGRAGGSGRSPRESIEDKRSLRRSSIATVERSVWDDSPRSSIQSFFVARPQRQSDTPISWLPAEILCHIFEVLATDMPPRAPGGALDQVGSIGWIVVSHVCRHWREIALSMTTLWAESVGTLVAASETMLERAQGTPITLLLNHTHRDASFHTAHLHLAKALVIDVSEASYSSNVLYDVRMGLAMQPLPTLEILSVAHAFGRIPPHNFDLPPINAPSLRRISMENYFLPWSSSVLTDLSLSRTKMQIDGRPSFEEILTLLRNTPTLRRLSLKNWVSETGGLPEGEHRISLPFLMRIEIRDRPTQCITLWNALAIPASAHVVLAIDLLGVAPDTAVSVPNAIFRVLGPHYRVPHAAPFESLALTDCRGDSFLRIRALVRDKPRSAVRSPTARLSVDYWPWHSPRGITGFQHVLAAFSLHVGLSHVRALTLDCAADDDGGDAAALGWRESLEPMTALRVLEVHDRAPPSLLRALGRVDADADEAPVRVDVGRLLLPGLHTLALRPCAHRRRDEARGLAWMALYNALRQRARMNRALRKLQLFGYFRLEPATRTRTFQDELDKVVVEIDWDL
ncbi:hypothetical protein K488DRAFT_87202 [Vararia minispora EC-137]|uniref:Uncharacterized protein n=1 Tax=Vararia minispora EC-137 TaxID=1314806 RepID=A0ACB8QHB4_9AGAM|nr:hypothetical protein K488DRAFT_87202 [Vararia minispora EC-137]